MSGCPFLIIFPLIWVNCLLFRSRVAVSALHKDGYQNLGWLAGGFSRASEKDFADVEGQSKLQYATVGGVSYIFLRLLILLRVLE